MNLHAIGSLVTLGESSVSGCDVCVENVRTKTKAAKVGTMTAGQLTLKHRIARGVMLVKQKSSGQRGSSEALSNRQVCENNGSSITVEKCKPPFSRQLEFSTQRASSLSGRTVACVRRFLGAFRTDSRNRGVVVQKTACNKNGEFSRLALFQVSEMLREGFSA
jgi:hypothetical protein